MAAFVALCKVIAIMTIIALALGLVNDSSPTVIHRRQIGRQGMNMMGCASIEFPLTPGPSPRWGEGSMNLLLIR